MFSIMNTPSTQTLARPLTLDVENAGSVSALLLTPGAPKACYLFAHGAGAGMNHAFMKAAAEDLAELGVATLRFQFPYMERGSKRTDPPPLCHATVRAAASAAATQLSGIPLIAGGRSFGGRMTSQTQAEAPLPGVRGLVFLGFPLHPAGRPETTRAAHLIKITIPMLFVQGTRDELATMSLLDPLVAQLAPRATLHSIADADHSLHVPARTGRKDPEVRAAALQAMVAWMDAVIAMQR
jgi:predicted alpha/beta-hydrolase family hydrolase